MKERGVYVPPVVFDDVVDVVEPARVRLVEREGQYDKAESNGNETKQDHGCIR